MVDKSAVGETGEAFDLTVERGKVREFARATKSENPEYVDDAAPVQRFILTFADGALKSVVED